MELKYLPNNHDVYWMGRYIPAQSSYKIGYLNGSPDLSSYLLGKAWYHKPASGTSVSFEGLTNGIWYINFSISGYWETNDDRNYTHGSLIGNGTLIVSPYLREVRSESSWLAMSGYYNDGDDYNHEAYYQTASNLLGWIVYQDACGGKSWGRLDAWVNSDYNSANMSYSRTGSGNTVGQITGSFINEAYFIKMT